MVFLVYGEGTADALAGGTGFVVPRGMAPMTAATWLSSKWPAPAFGTRAVVRCYVGGVGSEDVVDEPDEDLLDACARHLAAVVPLPGAPRVVGRPSLDARDAAVRGRPPRTGGARSAVRFPAVSS